MFINVVGMFDMCVKIVDVSIIIQYDFRESAIIFGLEWSLVVRNYDRGINITGSFLVFNYFIKSVIRK